MSYGGARGSIVLMSRSDIDETVRDMWSTRPRRRKDDRKIAGVAAAIGRRYGIDPVLVRVAFVVTTIFGGIGIALYLLGWLLLPEDGDEVSSIEALLGQGQSSMSKPLTIVLAVALIPASSGLFTGHVSALLSLAAVAAGVYLLHRHRAGTQPAATGVGPFDTGFNASLGAPPDAAAGGTAHASTATAPTAASTSGTAPADTPAEGADRTTPPAWDPLGAAPFAWDLPEPSPAGPEATPEPPARRRRSAVTPVTLALALMVGGAAAIVALTTNAFGPAEVAAVTLAVVGVGLIVGSLVRGGRGLIAVAIPLALATYALSMAPVSHFGPQYGVGDRTERAATAKEVDPTYRLSAGDFTLDLRDLRLDAGENPQTSVQLGVGDLKVLLPPNLDVQVHCEANVGDVDCLGDHQEGKNPMVDEQDFGADGPAGGTLVLNASVGAGQIQVTREN